METAVQMKNIVKVYPNGVMANEGVNFSISEGEIHALVGENGAGKTTLMKILFGIEQPTGGTIEVFGKEVSIHSVAQALGLGLGMVQQHFMLVPSMTVAENILLGAEPVKGIVLNRGEAERVTRALCEKYSFNIDVNARIDDLPVGDKQKVEILKVLYRQAKVIILDEPTAVLTPQETEELFKQLIILKTQGHTIVFISHKLREIEAICDRVTIMRKGTTVGVYNLSEITTEKISEYMMGQEVQLGVNKKPAAPGEVRLLVDGVSYVNDENKTVVDGVSFGLRAGEILGVVGVEGNGQKELVDMITGFAQPQAGLVRLGEENIAKKSICHIRGLSLAYIPQERMSTGIAADSSITENLSSVIYRKKENQRGPLLNWKKLAGLAKSKIAEYTVKTDSEKTPLRMLSGGNIQKVVVAREFMDNPRVIVADQPTRGVDVGAASLIHNKLVELRDAGSAVLLVTSDLSEVMSLSDSIIVMYNGKISAYFADVANLAESDLGLYMLGVKTQQQDEIRRCWYGEGAQLANQEL
ncbi:MAG: ABC transporter ATP-binding protein [Oscillospiraceae bacterium]